MYGTCLTLWEPYVINGKTKDGSTKSKEVFIPKCLVILSSHQYLMAFREFLTQLNRLSKMGEMMYPVERYIANFCAEIPAPAPGSFEVQTTILDSVIRIWAPPHNQPIPWVALPFAHLFECLDVDNIIKVWHCLALEQQVLLTSAHVAPHDMRRDFHLVAVPSSVVTRVHPAAPALFGAHPFGTDAVLLWHFQGQPRQCPL